MYRDVTKKAAKQLVAVLVAGRVQNFLEEHTDVNTDSKVLKVGLMFIGEMVATRLQDHTNKLVDNVADWIESKRKKPEKK